MREEEKEKQQEEKKMRGSYDDRRDGCVGRVKPGTGSVLPSCVTTGGPTPASLSCLIFNEQVRYLFRVVVIIVCMQEALNTSLAPSGCSVINT